MGAGKRATKFDEGVGVSKSVTESEGDQASLGDGLKAGQRCPVGFVLVVSGRSKRADETGAASVGPNGSQEPQFAGYGSATLASLREFMS